MHRISLKRVDDVETMSRALRVTIRTRLSALHAAGLSVGVLGAAGLAWGLVDGPAGSEGAFESLLGALSAFSVAALPLAAAAFLAVKLVWGVAGRETLVLDRHGLWVRQSVGPLGLSKTYPSAGARLCDGMGDPRADDTRPFWEFLCIESGRGSVVFCHENRTIRIARDLDKAEGVYLVTAIRILMQSR
jgi:hypothetical protein